MNWSNRRILTLCVLIGLACAARAQDPALLETDRKIVAAEAETSELMANLEYLSDVIGPRVTGSAALRQANLWVADRMRAYGLENVHQEDHTIPVGWQRGRVEFRLLTPRAAEMTAAAMAWTPGTHGLVRGPVVLFDPADEADRDARFAGKLKNAIVLMSAPARVQQVITPQAPRGTDQFGEELEQQRRQSAAIAFLASEGAAAVLRDAAKPHGLLNMTGSWFGLDNRGRSKTPRLTTLFVTHEAYSMLYRLLQRKEPVEAQLRVESRFVKGPITVSNTVGEIRGAEKPDEIVLCGAHLDSWDLGEGTVDNGTGSMVVLEAARLLKALGVRPARTIRFVLFYGEEEGLVGSAAYVQRHRAEMDHVSAVFVNDTGTGRVTGIGLHGNPQLRPVFETEWPILKELGVTGYNTFLMGGTDHASFAPAGVPACWFTQVSGDYGLMHHSQSDTFDKALPDDLKQCASVMAICAYNAAQRPALLPRKAQ